MDQSATLDQSISVWDLLTRQVEAFLEAWDAGPAPSLDRFIPTADQTLRRLVLGELIKVDMEQRWARRSDPKLLEAYVAEFSDLIGGEGITPDLIYEEYHVRRQSGDDVSQREYFQRFPERAEELGRLLGLEEAGNSTAMISASARPRDIEAGERLDDFTLLLPLGEGAFAKVFLARQESMQRLVALKVSADQGREPETLAQLDHPSIVRVFDQRSLPDQGLRLLYMQYVPGETLAGILSQLRGEPRYCCSGRAFLGAVDAALSRRGENPPESSMLRQRLEACSPEELAAEVGVRLAEALDYAHRQGVLHRDLKPANIMISSEGAPKIVDFNVSFCSQLEGATPAAFFGGSLAYMSPEQLDACNPRDPADAASLDGRSDVYSLGMILYELLLGVRPFGDERLGQNWSDTLQSMALRRRNGMDADALASQAQPSIAEVVAKSLAADPRDRFVSAGELARALRLCLEPDVQHLLRQRQSDWRSIVRRAITPTVVAVVVLPNALAGFFNFAYNFNWTTNLYPETEAVFGRVSTVINAFAFTLGILAGLVLLWPVARAMSRYRKGRAIHASELPGLRRRCLRLSHYAALIGIVEWLIAGALFPVALQMSGVPLRAVDYLHFCASLALCGLIAASYPFFLVSFVMLRAVYPVLIHPASLSPQDDQELVRFSRRIRPYLYLAVALPLFGVLILVVVEELGGHTFPLALLALSAGGVLGLGPILWLAQRIPRDTELLRRGIQLMG